MTPVRRPGSAAARIGGWSPTPISSSRLPVSVSSTRHCSGRARSAALLADLGADVHQGRVAERRLRAPDDLADRRRRLAAALQVNRGKRGVALDLRTAGRRRDLPRPRARAPTPSIEAMRPGRARHGAASASTRCSRSTRASCCAPSPATARPARTRDMPSHGIAYDTWAGVVAPGVRRARLPVSAGAHVDRHPRRARSSARSPSSPGILQRAGDRQGHASSRSRSRMRRRPSTGIAAKRSRRTNGPRTRSPATRPTTTSAARRARRA